MIIFEASRKFDFALLSLWVTCCCVTFLSLSHFLSLVLIEVEGFTLIDPLSVRDKEPE